jgi:hypothetical protein
MPLLQMQIEMFHKDLKGKGSHSYYYHHCYYYYSVLLLWLLLVVLGNYYCDHWSLTSLWCRPSSSKVLSISQHSWGWHSGPGLPDLWLVEWPLGEL